MSTNVSRRSLFGGVGLLATGLASKQAIARELGSEVEIACMVGIKSVKHRKIWLHFDKDELPALAVSFDGGIRERVEIARQSKFGRAATLRATWRPDLDLWQPCVPQELVLHAGESVVGNGSFPDSFHFPVAFTRKLFGARRLT